MPVRPGLPNPGDVIGGKYQLTREIGAGGMGVVYEATHLRLRQRVAIKMLQPELATRGDVVARFEREARAAVKLRSRHVARVIDVDALDDGTPYLVMEFLEGRDLAAEIAARGPLPVSEAVDYVLETCDAMGEAHRQGTVHRDLKPGNLFLASDERGRVLKVLDFGISKIDEEGPSPSVTSTCSVLGTALYMSPEQVRSAKRVDARSDVWALGVILYELLAGRSPFHGPSATAVAAAVVADVPLPLGTYRQDVPKELEAAIMVALEKDRDRRFSDASALAVAIAPFASAPRASASVVTASRPREPLEHASDGPALLPPLATVTAAGWDPVTPRGLFARRSVMAASLAALAVATVAVLFAIVPRGSTLPGPAPAASEPGVTMAPAAPSQSTNAATEPPPRASAAEPSPPSDVGSAAAPAPSASTETPTAPAHAPTLLKPGGPPRVAPAPPASKPPAPADSSHKARPAAPSTKKRMTDLPADPG